MGTHETSRMVSPRAFRSGVACLLISSAACVPAAICAAVPARLPVAGLRADLELVCRSLKEGSPELDRHTSAAELDRVCRSAISSVDRPLDAVEFYRVVAAVVAAVKNGHTQLSLPVAESEELRYTLPLLPLGVRVLAGRIFVLRDFSGLQPSLAGSEVLAVNGIAAPELVARMLALVSADGDVMSSRWRIISGWGFDYGLFTAFGFRDRFALSLRGRDGGRREISVDGVAGKALIEVWRKSYPDDLEAGGRRPFGLRFYDGDRIALLTIPHWDDFVDPDRKTPIEAFFETVLAELKAKGSRVLIIDLRDNGGGEDAHAVRLASYFVATPFRFFDDVWMKGMSFDFLRYAGADYRQAESTTLPKDVSDLAELGSDGRFHMRKLPYFGIQQPSAPGFRGKVYLLSNGNSFSTTTEFSAFLQSSRLAEVVGEEGSGYWRANTSGVEPTLTLPNSGLRLTVPLMAFDSALGDGPPGAHGVLADHEVTYSIDDLLAGTDKDLEVALQLARGTPVGKP